MQDSFRSEDSFQTGFLQHLRAIYGAIRPSLCLTVCATLCQILWDSLRFSADMNGLKETLPSKLDFRREMFIPPECARMEFPFPQSPTPQILNSELEDSYAILSAHFLIDSPLISYKKNSQLTFLYQFQFNDSFECIRSIFGVERFLRDSRDLNLRPSAWPRKPTGVNGRPQRFSPIFNDSDGDGFHLCINCLIRSR